MLLTAIIFLLLTAYYVLKVVREPLILTDVGAEVKSYSAFLQAPFLLLVVRGYAWLYPRLGRLQLLVVVHLVFVVSLIAFYGLSLFHLPLGLPFFLWVGIFNITTVAQLWALACDIYTPEQGHRLLAVVGLGSSLGALAGAQLAGLLLVQLGPYRLMLLAALLVLGSCLVTAAVCRRESGRLARPVAPAARPRGDAGERAGFALVLRDRYLLLVAGVTLLLNWVGTLGEYILDRTLLAQATATVATDPGRMTVVQYIASFRASYFGWVSLLGLLMQLLLVAPAIRWLGVRAVLFVLPLLALSGWGLIAVLPLLPIIGMVRIAESSVSYSLQNTARQSLFLVTSTEAKYVARTTIDTLFWRGGDLMAALTIGLGSLLALGARSFVYTNIGLVLIWLLLVLEVSRQHRRRCQGAEQLAPQGGAVRLERTGEG